MDTPNTSQASPSAPTQSVSQMPPAVPTVKKGMAKGVLVLIAVGILAAGYFAYAYLTGSAPFAPASPAASESPTPSPTPSPSTSPTTDPTAGWQTYTSAQYGFSFKTPPQWVAEGTNAPRASTFFDPTVTYKLEGQDFHPSVSFTVQEDTFGGSIAEYEKTLAPAVRAIRQQGTVTIGGKTAYVYSGVTPPTAHEFRVVFAGGFVYVINSNVPLVYASAGTAAGDSAKAEFELILSTFRFTK